MLEALAGRWPIHTIVNRTDLPSSRLLKQTRVPVPARPVFVRTIFYAFFSAAIYWLRVRTSSNTRIAAEGAYPFCHISHVQFCHRYFLLHYSDVIATTWARRLARTINYRWCAFLEPIAFRHARKIIVPSQGLVRELELMYPEMTRGKIEVIPSPVDVSRFQRKPDFSPFSISQKLGIPRNAFVLSFCALGGFTRKGLPLILKALQNLNDPLIHLLVIGGTASEIREFTLSAERSNVISRVHFAGLQEDVRPYLWSSHVYVFPSAYETFSLACFQAAAAGIPLIATRLNGVEEFLEPGVNGWLVERSADSVKIAIQEAAASREKTARMGEAAQAKVQSYAAEIFQARWLAMLDREFGIRADQVSPHEIE